MKLFSYKHTYVSDLVQEMFAFLVYPRLLDCCPGNHMHYYVTCTATA